MFFWVWVASLDRNKAENKKYFGPYAQPDLDLVIKIDIG